MAPYFLLPLSFFIVLRRIPAGIVSRGCSTPTDPLPPTPSLKPSFFGVYMVDDAASCMKKFVMRDRFPL